MSSLDRFSNRHYYETKFMEDGTVLWLAGIDDTVYRQEYAWLEYILALWGYGDYPNTQFKPAELYTLDSTPDYFLVDIYGISAGGYSAYRSDKHHHGIHRHYDDHYFGGGSGACLFLGNIKIRLRDEDGATIIYNLSGKPKPEDWRQGKRAQQSPVLVNNNINDWKISLGGPFRTPYGVAPAGTVLLGMGAGGNASMGSYRVGNGGTNIYIPTRCVQTLKFDELRVYTVGEQYFTGECINYNGTAYNVTNNFTATEWVIDTNNCSVVGTYSDSTRYYSGSYFWYEGNLYKTTQTFQGDPGNSIYGFADYFLKKDVLSSNIQRQGRDGGYEKDSPHWTYGGTPDRIFTEESLTDANRVWVEKTLSWGRGQDTNRTGYNGQGGGIVVIYHGETN